MSDSPEVQEIPEDRKLEWWQRWLLEGEQRGLKKGRDEGRLQGEARVLRWQLALYFAPFPAWVDAKLAAATEEELLRWGEAMLTASTLEEVFKREA